MARFSDETGRVPVTFHVTPRQKRILEALSIVWRRSMQDILMTCVQPVLDQHEEYAEKLEEIRAEAGEE